MSIQLLKCRYAFDYIMYVITAQRFILPTELKAMRQVYEVSPHSLKLSFTIPLLILNKHKIDL